MTLFTDSGASGNGSVSVGWDYDAASNIRHMASSYRPFDYTGVQSTATVTQDYWYKYDGLNRFTTVRGSLVNGQIVRGSAGGPGVDITYNGAGQRATATTSATLTGTGYGWVDHYEWDEYSQTELR
jgi:hypothetical protein